jgi:NADH-quinone oxidoreductase subunit N
MNLIVLTPHVTLIVFAFFILMCGLLFPRARRGVLAILGLIGIVLTMILSARMWGLNLQAFWGMLALDTYGLAFAFVFLVGAAVTFLLSMNKTEGEYVPYTEYLFLVLTACSGMMFMASGTHLIVIFIGLEILSISLYILAGIRRNDAFSLEAAFKYFLLGAFASAFLLYGIALIYGVTGTAHLTQIARVIGSQGLSSPLLTVGLVLMIIGFGFKVALVPFHMWAPDVYQGAPTPIAAFMAVGSKAAGFAALLRILMVALRSQATDWSGLLWILAVITMFVGNIIALSQSNIKRMLAYSSIAHAGYILVGLIARNDMGSAGVLFYLAAYTFMNLGAFGVVVALGKFGEENLEITDYQGIGFRRPLVALAMTVFMFSLAGIPPAAGFMAKFYIFSAAVKAGQIPLVIIGVVNSMISVYYYLRIVVFMYMKDPEREIGHPGAMPAVSLALLITALATLYIGLFPNTLMELFQTAIKAVM